MTGERMKILIVSDTHGRHRNLEEVLDREGPIDMLVHLGKRSKQFLKMLTSFLKIS